MARQKQASGLWPSEPGGSVLSSADQEAIRILQMSRKGLTSRGDPHTLPSGRRKRHDSNHRVFPSTTSNHGSFKKHGPSCPSATGNRRSHHPALQKFKAERGNEIKSWVMATARADWEVKMCRGHRGLGASHAGPGSSWQWGSSWHGGGGKPSIQAALPELEQGSERQRPAWGMTMSSVPGVQGARQKVKSWGWRVRRGSILDGGGLGVILFGLGEPGTDFKQKRVVFDREFSDASWEMWGGGAGGEQEVEGGQVTAGRQVGAQT